MNAPTSLETRVALHAAREAAQAHRTHVLHFLRRQSPLTASEEALLAQLRKIELMSLKAAGIAASPDSIPVLTDKV